MQRIILSPYKPSQCPHMLVPLTGLRWMDRLDRFLEGLDLSLDPLSSLQGNKCF